ncbi:MAG TPA: phosphoenolpyruvate carboxylase, partial [Actinomycetota bacterium]|nr:phosphoenolpyruvate carboxylase [Actinomycetota bacterium]
MRLLTTMLGDAIAESGGAELLAEVEALRRATIAYRGHPTRTRLQRITEIVDGLDLRRAEDVIRAFTCYFQLVNLAEERHRVRTLRRRARSGTPVKDSISALEHVAVDDLRIRPVLTAHPTEAKRRAVVEHLWRIGDLVEQLEDLPLGASEEQEVHRRMREEIAGLWRTDPIRPHRPEPLDEVRAVLALFDQTIFTTLPAVMREMDRRLDPEGVGTRPPGFEAFLRWGTWVGGDRDGNPGVTAEVTRAAMSIQSDHVLRGLEAASRRIARTLSVSARDVPPTRSLQRALSRAAAGSPRIAAELERKLSDSPHRRMLGLAAHRLAATREGTPGAYGSPTELLRDIDVLQGSLDHGGAPRLAYGELQHLRWQVEAFGFHLASMEVRQHSSVLAAALSEITGDGRRAVKPSPQAREVVATFRAIAEIQQRFGAEACDHVVVSFTRSADDLAGVVRLARLAVPEEPPEVVPVPLLESRLDLAAAAGILDDWISRS